MKKRIQEFRAHRRGGWQEQYNRAIRWTEKFKFIDISEKESKEKSDEYFDIMYACFQNIFFLKDWLIEQTLFSKEDLNTFIKTNKEIGICRDICNGTKHYNINRHASVDKEFGVIKQFNPLSKINNKTTFGIIICADFNIYDPQTLMDNCIKLWDKFISDKLNLRKTPN